MLALVLLLLYASAVSTAGARTLRRAAWVERSPRLGILAWLTAAGSAGLAMILAGITLLLPDLHVTEHFARMVHVCVAEVRDRYSTPLGFVLPWAIVTLAAVVLVRFVLIGAVEHLSALWSRHVMRRDLTALGSHEPACAHRDDYVSLDQEAALIYCVPGGRRATVVVTSGAESLLTHDELAAALGHERAHLRRKHHVPIMISRVVAATFLNLGIFREAAEKVALLAEMDADDGARHLPGLQGALARLALASSPVGALGAGGASAVQRLRRLHAAPAPLPLPARVGVRLGLAAAAAMPVAIALLPTIQAFLFDCCGGTTLRS